VYDMYPWDEGSAADAADVADAVQPEPAVSAVQVALDRRDNGGDPATAPGTPTASPARQ
jgi:hypothetical protein